MELITKPAGSYEYDPPIHPLFRGADVVLDLLVMQKMSRGVLSHKWHWDRLPFDPRFKDYAVPIKGDPKTKLFANPNPIIDLFYRVKGHLGAVSTGYLIDVDLHSMPAPFEIGEFFYGFSNSEMSYLCRSRIAMSRMFMLLTGPDDWYAYLMDKNGNPLPGKLMSPLISWEQNLGVLQFFSNFLHIFLLIWKLLIKNTAIYLRVHL